MEDRMYLSAIENLSECKWQECDSLYKQKVISAELCSRMKQGFVTTFDDRYGIHWEKDEWFYIYRSGFMHYRLKLNLQQDGTYRISTLQRSNNTVSELCLDEVFYSLEYHWKYLSESEPLKI